MNGLPYYKAYPRDFIEGTIGMCFELKGAYRLLLDLIYMQGGDLQDDPRYIAGTLGCSVRAWTGYRARLVETGKIVIQNGIISNFRANLEMDKLKMMQEKQRENGSKPKKNNDITKATAEPRLNHTEPEPEPERKREANASHQKRGIDLTEALTIFNGAAARQGWPQVKKMTPARQTALRARLADAEGMDGWAAAVRRAEASDFLSGRTERAFRLTFDFLTGQQNFTKLTEGNYDNRKKETPHLRPVYSDEEYQRREELYQRQLEKARAEYGN
jgi:uncharacterized protein YdaU (DUF1376 family)